MNWMVANHFTSQILTGHGGFKWKLTQFRLSTGSRCDWGAQEMALHVLYECLVHNEERQKLADASMVELGTWLVQPGDLVGRMLLS